MVNTIRLAGIEPESYTDGEGIRYTIFVQGCAHRCHNCHNPETWDFKGGRIYNIESIISDIESNPLLDGVTISGGDPMYSTDTIIELVNQIKSKLPQLDIWLYTGFTYEECVDDKNKLEVLKYINVLVDGVYVEKLRSLQLKFKGSSNQRIIDVQKSLSSGKVHLWEEKA